MPMDAIWETTPATAMKVYENYVARLQTEVDKVELLAWRMGYYNTVGFHQPKKYPRKPAIKKPETIDSETAQKEYEDELDAFLSKLPTKDKE